MKHSDFVHLHCHTQYSLLDGANPIDSLLQQAAVYRMPALAITDHGNLFGAIEFYQKARAAGIKPIIGCEMYVAPKSHLDKESGGLHHEYYHLILLAADRTGYKNLIKLVSTAHLDGFYYKPRIDKELLQKHHEGLIGLSACLRGEVPTLLTNGEPEKALAAAGEHEEILGKGNFYLELQHNGLEAQQKVNAALVELHRKTGMALVATNDAHYLTRGHARAHDILLCLQTGKTVNDQDRMRFGSDENYLKSAEEMTANFSELPEAVLNSKLIAERCNLDLPFDKFHLPHYKVPGGFTREQYLERLAREGLADRLKSKPPDLPPDDVYERRLATELAVLNSMGYAGYFLIVWDIINYARSHGIPVGPGRGSAAGSLVAYALRITDIDPLRYNLLFERFLNPERVSLPDIDMDFCMDRREEVIRYVTGKFGSDHVCQIITFGTMAAKAVIRDVGRVLELPYAEVDKVAKLVPNTLGITLDEAVKAEPRLQELTRTDPKIQELLTLARSLEGLARHASTHAAGVVISEEPLTDHVPLYRGAKGEIVTQYSKDDLEKIGLVKFDLLGLRTLTVIDQTIKLINKKRPSEEAIRLSKVPLDDPKTYQQLSTGQAAGIFQLESRGMSDLLVKLKPEGFEDLIAILALYRPGPIGSGMVDDFIKRKRGLKPIQYELPQLEEILKETYGVIVYQEQVMTIANVLAGFSLGQADLLRRAMGKKKPEEMEKQKERFIQGARKNGIPEKKAEKIFDLMAYFAGYGFNKSHSAAYALISYQTAYLKTHYPVEFMAALLSSEMGNADKVVRYITECRQLGIKILPPDVNESRRDFTVVEEGIRFGLAAIKNVGENAIEAIGEAREQGGPFPSIFDFCRRVDSRKVNRRALEGLIKSGALDSTGAKRSQMTAVMEKAVEEGGLEQRDRLQGQAALFGHEPNLAGRPTPDPLPPIEEWDEAQRLRFEKESVGFYITSHPLARYADELRSYATANAETLDETPQDRQVKLCGIIAQQKIMTTKRGDKMALLTLEDLQGTVEVLVFPDLYKKISAVLTPDTPFLVTGFVDKSEKGAKVKAVGIEPLSRVREQITRRVDIRLNSTGLTSQDIQRLKEILLRHRGPCPVFLRIEMPNRTESTIAVDEQVRIKPSDLFISEIEQEFGKGTVIFR
ncbi:MAG: DNA polymerase III subunit alpha [Nitrospirae bacterium]|nr:DNA polymerase III subunit alpha [Nitrospirota bacterium]